MSRPYPFYGTTRGLWSMRKISAKTEAPKLAHETVEAALKLRF
jgi:hypothetical protein